jgi:Ca2+-binding RTX toxin-like protein
MAVVVAFLIGCAVLILVLSCAGTRSESPKEQGPTEATEEQAHSERCEGTRTYDYQTKDPTIVLVFTTNDIPGCPKGGLLSGTDKRDFLKGKDGEDKVRGLGGSDNLYGGSGNDNLYGGPDGDYELIGGEGDDVLHGGDGGDALDSVGKSASAEGDDVLYGGDGRDTLSGNGGGRRCALWRQRSRLVVCQRRG